MTSMIGPVTKITPKAKAAGPGRKQPEADTVPLAGRGRLRALRVTRLGFLSRASRQSRAFSCAREITACQS